MMPLSDVHVTNGNKSPSKRGMIEKCPKGFLSLFVSHISENVDSRRSIKTKMDTYFLVLYLEFSPFHFVQRREHLSPTHRILSHNHLHGKVREKTLSQ